MSKVFKTTTHYEFGYRQPNGEEWWEVEHGIDGVWIPWNPDAGLPEIDVYGRGGDVNTIRNILDARGYSDWPVLMRKIETTYYEAEEVA